MESSLTGNDITGKQVTAELTVTMTGDGEPAGGCTSPAEELPADGTGTISCVNATGAWQAFYTRAQEQDQAATDAGEQPPPHQYAAEAAVAAHAMAQPDVVKIENQLKQDARQAKAAENCVLSAAAMAPGGHDARPGIVTAAAAAGAIVTTSMAGGQAAKWSCKLRRYKFGEKTTRAMRAHGRAAFADGIFAVVARGRAGGILLPAGAGQAGRSRAARQGVLHQPPVSVE